MKKFKTDQEKFWAGEFGDKYIARNDDPRMIAANLAVFSQILARTADVHSVIEFGANIGLNLRAVRQLLPSVDVSAVEINSKAAERLAEIEGIKIYNQSILDFDIEEKKDFVLIKGVLIHINPDELKHVYEKLYNASSRYICISEYYNPTPVTIDYRGHSEKLFKRDFAGEFMDMYSDVRLLDYGFNYHRDPNFRYSDVTWFLMEKVK